MEQESLHDYLDQEHQQTQRIKNDMQANHIIRKIEALREKKQLNQLLARSEIERIKKWRDGVNAELDQQIQQYRKLIHEYMADLRKKTNNPSLKQLHLPYGTVTFQPQRSKWHYDEERLIDYFLKSQQLEFLRIQLNKKKMRDYFHETNTSIYDPKTGQPLEGVTVEQQGEFFSVKPKK